MMLEYKGQKPKIGKNVFIAPTATVIGDVEIKDGASIWYGTVLRGDRAAVSVGENSNIQDNLLYMPISANLQLSETM